jgi:purine-binding chemotaxis protein CheW
MENRITHPFEGKYLLFSIAGQVYGVGMKFVREVMNPFPLRLLRDGYPAVRGFLNLRGQDVPVVDLRRKLGMEEAEIHPGSSVLAVLARGWEGAQWMGLLVDGILQVAQFGTDDLEKVPEMEADPREGWLLGLARWQEQAVLLLDVNQVAREEIETIQLV